MTRLRKGGGAAEAEKFTEIFQPFKTDRVQQSFSRLNEQAVELHRRPPSIMCGICALRFEPKFPVWCRCGPGCYASTCSFSCFQRDNAQRCKVPIGGHVQLGLFELSPPHGIAEAVLALSVHVVPLALDTQVTSPHVVLIINITPAILLPAINPLSLLGAVTSGKELFESLWRRPSLCSSKFSAGFKTGNFSFFLTRTIADCGKCRLAGNC